MKTGWNRMPLVLFCALTVGASYVEASGIDLKIVTFGDSTTFEHPSFKEIPPGGGPEVPIVSYSTYLAQDLPGKVLPSGQVIQNASVLNQGVSGNNTTQARARFHRDVLDQNPNIVIIQFGWNDQAPKNWKSTTPPDEIDKSPRVELAVYEDNLQYMISQLAQAEARVILMTPDPGRWRGYNYFQAEDPYVGYDPLHPDEEDWKWGYNARITSYCQVVRKLATKNGVELVDAHALFRAYDEVDGQDVDALYRKTIRFPDPYRIPGSDPAVWLPPGDGVHPGSAGHRMIADALIRQITSPVPEPDGISLLTVAACSLMVPYHVFHGRAFRATKTPLRTGGLGCLPRNFTPH